MAILKNCEIWFLKADPKRPNAKYSRENPTWEAQIRTRSREQRNEWKQLGLSVKDVVPEDGSAPFFRVNLRKKSIKEDKTPASPVVVKDGQLNDLDPRTVGNGSMGNVRIFQYEYPKGEKEKGIASVLMGVQITKLIKYTPKARDDDFEQTDTEVVDDDVPY